MNYSCGVRDIVIFGPTHINRESGLLLSGCRPPAENCFYAFFGGCWKRKARERTPTWAIRVKNCFTRHTRVLFEK